MLGKREALIRIRNILLNIERISIVSLEDRLTIERLEIECEAMVSDQIDNYMAGKYRVYNGANHPKVHKFPRSA